MDWKELISVCGFTIGLDIFQSERDAEVWNGSGMDSIVSDLVASFRSFV
jgi:hypothetical protein